MAPPTWMTIPECTHCQEFLAEYSLCRPTCNYTAFWPKINASFFANFSLVEKLFPGMSLGNLVLSRWFRWQFNPRSRNSCASIPTKLLKEIYKHHTCAHKAYEAFAKVYPEAVHTALNELCEKEGIPSAKRLGKWHGVCEVVREYLVEAGEDLDEDENGGEAAAHDYDRFLAVLPGVLNVVVDPAVRKAGALAVVTIVAPDPVARGELKVDTFQFRDKEETLLFAGTWMEYDSKFVPAVTSWALRHEYTADECTRHAGGKPLEHSQLEAIDAEGEDSSPAVKGSPSPPASPHATPPAMPRGTPPCGTPTATSPGPDDYQGDSPQHLPGPTLFYNPHTQPLLKPGEMNDAPPDVINCHFSDPTGITLANPGLLSHDMWGWDNPHIFNAIVTEGGAADPHSAYGEPSSLGLLMDGVINGTREAEAFSTKEAEAEAARAKELDAVKAKEAEAVRAKEAEAVRAKEAEAEAARAKEVEAVKANQAKEAEVEAARVKELEAVKAKEEEAEALKAKGAEAEALKGKEAEAEALRAKEKKAEVEAARAKEKKEKEKEVLKVKGVKSLAAKNTRKVKAKDAKKSSAKKVDRNGKDTAQKAATEKGGKAAGERKAAAGKSKQGNENQEVRQSERGPVPSTQAEKL
ncbi:hypothetical protein FA15DRAFT_709606 [Coprinopsis marcescibilis]|uniref:Uncharacterized protein n=1 Tax=Coprinopsis marcescibilis TaxID=230819 RepID=A0A5C3KG38_COPMA|nr:hypothetical protein FA15DRAFT_709606 [Coprinopsis marcescibilis]